jgi:hypothetical protein
LCVSLARCGDESSQETRQNHGSCRQSAKHGETSRLGLAG